MEQNTYTKLTKGRAFLDAFQNTADLLRPICDTGGPKGRLMMLDGHEPSVTKDGFTIGKTMNSKDPTTNSLIALYKKALGETNKDAGDGTTYFTSVFVALCDNLVQLGFAEKNIPAMKEAYRYIRENILEAISKVSKPVNLGSEEVKNIAVTAANGDLQIGASVAEALNKAGRNGVITIENSKTSEPVEIESTSGLTVDRGYVSPYFSSNKNGTWEAENPLVVVLNQKVSSMSDLLPIFEKVVQGSRQPLLLIVEDLEGEALAATILNKIRGVIDICAIKAPGFGDSRLAMLEDISILTKAKLVNKDSGISLADSTKAENIDTLFGSARKIVVTKDKTTITGKGDNENEITERIAQLKDQISRTTSDYDKNKLNERIAKLAGGVVIIKVGGSNEVEVGERKDRYEDALNAARAAIDEGIIPGGGTTQLAIEYCLQEKIKSSDVLSHPAKLIASAILSAFSNNIVNLTKNSAKSPEVVIEKLRQSFKDNNLNFSNLSYDSIKVVYDIANDEYVSPSKSGVNDAAKVCKVAFTRAVDLVHMLCLCGAHVSQVKNEEKSSTAGSMAGMPMGGMGGGMDDMMY